MFWFYVTWINLQVRHFALYGLYIIASINSSSPLDIALNTNLNITLSILLFVHMQDLNNKLKSMGNTTTFFRKMSWAIEILALLVLQATNFFCKDLKYYLSSLPIYLNYASLVSF